MAVIALAGAAFPAAAAPVTVGFSGVMGFGGSDPLGLLDPAIQPGSPLSGSYSIDPDQLTSSTSSYFGFSGTTLYKAAGGFGAFALSVAGVPFAGAIDRVLIGDNTDFCLGAAVPVCDVWGFGEAGPPTDRTFPSIFFVDVTATRLSSTVFFVNQEVAGWFLGNSGPEAGLLYLNHFASTAGPLAIGAIFQAVPVPEPASASLLAVGLAVLAARGRSRRRRSAR